MLQIPLSDYPRRVACVTRAGGASARYVCNEQVHCTGTPILTLLARRPSPESRASPIVSVELWRNRHLPILPRAVTFR